MKFDGTPNSGTAYIGIASKLTCVNKDCRIMARDDGTYIAVGVFSEGQLRNIRCVYCRGQIIEAPILLKESGLKYSME
jgi:hypothetical protein